MRPHDLHRVLATVRGAAEAAASILDAAMSLAAVDAAVLYVPEGTPPELRQLATRGPSPKASDLRLSECDAAVRAQRTAEPQILAVDDNAPWAGRPADATFRRRAALPMRDGDDTVAVLCIASHDDWPAATYAALEEIAGAAGPGLSRVCEFERLSGQVQKLTAIVDNAPDIIATFDEQLRHTFVNQRTVEITGIPRERYLGRTNRELGLPAALCDDWESAMRAAFERGRPVEVEFPFSGPRGRSHYQSRLVPQRGADGRVTQIIGITRDISERRRVEFALRDSERRYRLLAEWASDMISLHDPHGVYRYVSPACCRLIGYEPEELIGRNAYEFFHPDDLEAVRTSHSAVVQQDVVYRVDYRIRTKQGGYVWVETHSHLHRPDAECGEPHIVAVTRDITARKQAEDERAALHERLHHAQRHEMVGQVAGGVAHDLNNLLTAIYGHIELSKVHLSADHRAQDSLAEVEKAARQATELTSVMMSMGRQTAPQLRPLELRGLVDATCQLLEPLLPGGVELKTEPHDDPPAWVRGDPVQLQQVLMNLVLNARDALPDGGQITIELTRTTLAGQSTPMLLRVRDTGTGMPAHVRRRIFDPFFTTKGPERGTGLGLAIVRRIVEQHNGTITVESASGAGTTFTIELPVCAAPAGSTADATPATIARHGLVMIAEPDRMVGGLLASALRAQQHDVVQVNDVGALHSRLDKLRERGRLLIIDASMPQKLGLRCLNDLRAQGAAVPAIVVASEVDADVVGILDDQTLLIRKPFRVSDVATLANRLMETTALPQLHSAIPATTGEE